MMPAPKWTPKRCRSQSPEGRKSGETAALARTCTSGSQPTFRTSLPSGPVGAAQRRPETSDRRRVGVLARGAQPLPVARTGCPQTRSPALILVDDRPSRRRFPAQAIVLAGMIASVPGVARVQCCRHRVKVGPTNTSSKLEPSCAVTAACTRLAGADSDQSEDGHNVRDHLKAPRQSRQPYASECARSGLMARCAHDGGRATSQYRTSPLALPVSRDADVRLRVAAEGLLVPWRNLRIQPTPLSVRNADLQQEPRSGGIRPQRKFPINQNPAA
jgi:hypothetical protein